MALRPLVLAAVVGLAGFAASYSSAAQAQSYFSVTIGSGTPQYHGGSRYYAPPRHGYGAPRHVYGAPHRVWRDGHHVHSQGGYGGYGGYGYAPPHGYRQPVQVYRTRPGYGQPVYGGGYRNGYYDGYRNGPRQRYPQSRVRVHYGRGW